MSVRACVHACVRACVGGARVVSDEAQRDGAGLPVHVDAADMVKVEEAAEPTQSIRQFSGGKTGVCRVFRAPCEDAWDTSTVNTLTVCRSLFDRSRLSV